jgi:hypothetical protein
MKDCSRPQHLRVAAALLIALVLALVISGAAEAAWFSLGGVEGSRVQVRVLESTPDRIVIDYSIPGFDATPVEIDGRTYFQITLPHESNRLDRGMPGLPHVCRSVIIPDAQRMAIRIIDSQSLDFAAMPVAPSKGNILRTTDPATVPYQFDRAFYGSDAVYPIEAVRPSGDPYILRDFRGLTVEILPFQAHASDGRLTAVRHMIVELTPIGADRVNVIDRVGPPPAVTTPFEEIYADHFLNYGMDRYTPVAEQGRILILCYSGFHSAMLPYIEWKSQEGIKTTIVDVGTEIPNTTTAIQNKIRDEYNLGGLAFVLLVGDAAQVTTPSAAGGSSDPTYTLLAGSDRYPELIIGRFSAETVAHVQTQVQRTVEYEKNPMTGAAAAWYAKGTGIGSDQGPGDDNEYDYQHENVIRQKLLTYGYTSVDQIYDPGATAAQVSAALNNGRSIVDYTGHGDVTLWGTTGFSNSNVAALTNDWMLPFIFSVACVNGQFNGTTCFAEAWLRSTHNSNPIGAIGTYMSSVNQSWNPPMCGQDGAVDVLVADTKHTFGALCFNGSCQMMDEYGATDGGDMFLTWLIFGDPSLLVRTKTPQTMIVDHDGTLLIGTSDYSVNVRNVPNALCALYANGVLYGSAYTNGVGLATIHCNPAPTDPMTLTLTVTAYNKVPAVETVEVLPPSGPYLTYSSSTLNDVAGGDGDGFCDAGESGGLFITLRNVGVATATGVSGTLTENDPYVTIVSGTATQAYGNIPAGATATSQGGYQLVFAPETPDDYATALHLALHSAEGDWTRDVGLTICSPVLGYASHVIDDSAPYGNGTGWVVANERVLVSVTVANAGHANARNVTATLVPNPYVTILDGTAEKDDIPAGASGTLSPFDIRINPDCPVPTVLTLQADLTADFSYVGTLSFQFSVGGYTDDCEANRGWTCGITGDTATSGIWISADPVGTTYGTPPQTVQPEDDHTDDPGHICFVTGNSAVGGAAGEADVDGGKTTLVSPAFDLSRVDGATVEYWVYYTNNRGNNPNQDYWTVQITPDGTNWTNLEYTTESTNAWAHRTFALLPTQIGSHVQLRFIADDQPSGSLVEALIDDFQITVEEPTPDPTDAPIGPQRLEFALDNIAPNPAGAAASVHFAVPRRMPVSLNVYDVAGRLVRRLANGVFDPGDHRLDWDRRNDSGRTVGSGVYFVQLDASGATRVRRVVLVD